ncbi:MarR family winged helix-turn-helix transcriptional regulator [Pararhodobacter zhoushanensis]|uniref:MarR family winged helix-turn-helix transcriptional regulator n=1 Tax=Pararhodobacter zhoushanensis TaxID=2479545 RepID=A0ABT3GXL6_9RHOB|nr:MarR family winged helix-turn-helix transcriptional regulator [Pararhodobacter zhoushanensis]MCW1932257.1 MarR family winged helix-turn-helix transcriptional regulator [Pararhodobacter zhoushanensis]
MTNQPRLDENPSHFKRHWPFFWVSHVSAGYVNALERRIKPLGLDIARWRALMCLFEDEYLSISEIADFSALKLNTTTKIVQRMIGEKLVTTRVRPSDGRVTEVCLTPDGDRLRKAAMEEAKRIFEATFEAFTDDEVAQLNTLLEKAQVQLQKL